jgi:hypothetical protein
LINLAIIAGAVATVLTASPALGGVAFSDWLNETFGLSSPAWQVLCAGAAVCSLSAAIATQLLKSHNIEEHVARAEAVRSSSKPHSFDHLGVFSGKWSVTTQNLRQGVSLLTTFRPPQGGCRARQRGDSKARHSLIYGGTHGCLSRPTAADPARTRSD